ncbi:MAG: hypothetical protein V1746_03725 [bacterium]
MNQKNISDLLKLKKLESPGPEYFEHFLEEFHRYQRAEILAQPSERLWAFWLRWFDWLSSVPRSVALCGATVASFAIAGVILISQPHGSGSSFAQGDRVLEGFSPKRHQVINAAVNYAYADPSRQQPELQRKVSVSEHDLSSPRYATGETVAPYETSLTF